MLVLCERAWKEGEVPDDWKKPIIIPLYKGKGSRSECSSYRGISLLSVPGKVYGRILTERLTEVTEGKVSEEQRGLGKGRGCVDQIFAMKRLVEEYLGKDKKLYVAFMGLEKANDRVNREALWSVMRMCDVGGQLLKGLQAFYREANACVRVGGERSDSFAVEVGVRQGCVVLVRFFHGGGTIPSSVETLRN